MKCEIRGFSFFHNDDGRKSYVNLASADLSFPEIKLVLRGVRLVHYPDKGFRANTPTAHTRNGEFAISWTHDGDIEKAARAVMVDAFKKMGGKLPDVPEAKTEFVSRAELGVSLNATKAEVIAALEAESEKRGRPVVTDFYERADDWQPFKDAAFAECDRAVENAKRKRKASDAAAAERRVAERKATVAVRSVEQIDADIAEMGLSRPETAGLQKFLGVA